MKLTLQYIPITMNPDVIDEQNGAKLTLNITDKDAIEFLKDDKILLDKGVNPIYFIKSIEEETNDKT